MKIPIVQLGDPVLRAPARPLNADELPGLRRTVEVMREIMRAAPGVGLAAPQIGLGIRLAVIEDDPRRIADDREAAAKARGVVPFTVLVNPVYEAAGDEISEFFEGCLSMDGYRALVRRHTRVVARWTDLDGAAHEQEFSGWPARIVQHEIDHLDGILYVDRCSTRSLTTLDNLTAHWIDRGTDEVRAALGVRD